jgi:hypothetical protein
MRVAAKPGEHHTRLRISVMTLRVLLAAAGLSACSASGLAEPDGGMKSPPSMPTTESNGGGCQKCVGGAGAAGQASPGGGLAPSASGGSVATAASVVDCGYPYASSNPLTSVVFDESEMLRAIEVQGGAEATVRLFFNDEHALTLGVRSVVVLTPAGAATTDYPVSPLSANPGSADYPTTGTSELDGEQSGLDPMLRPMWPALFITDITGDPESRSDDWQQGGAARRPSAVLGTWKAAVRTVDEATTPNAVAITADADPTENHWNLGPAADPVPSGVTVDEGYGAEVRWNLSVVPGHRYRIQVIVHDCDREKIGVSAGEICITFGA